MLDLTKGILPENVAKAIEGRLIYKGTKLISDVKIDSREIKSGDLFVAVSGEKTNGHNFIASAAEKGAAAVLIDTPDLADIDKVKEYGCSVILAKNTVDALGLFAKKYKEELSALTVAVTGSVGKTTTRQFIYSVLTSEIIAHKTEGNYNNELGLPLSVLKITPSHKASVLELGMSAKGEISYLTDIVKPDIAVVTNIGTAHIEHLGSREAIRDAKLEITEGLKPNGHLILNGDEPLLANITGACYVALKNKSADFRAERICFSSKGMSFNAICPDKIIKNCFIPTLGEHTVLDAMYAVACGYFAGISSEGIRKGLSSFETVGMRQNIKEQNGVTFILDYYNASPESIRASLNVAKQLSQKSGGRTIAVIGNVLELGSKSDELHRSIGKYIAEIKCDMFFAFGDDACIAAKQAISDGMKKENVFIFPDISDSYAISNSISEHIKHNDCILLKASRSIHMERVADNLLGK